MAQQVRNALLQRRQVFVRQLFLVQAAVHLQCAHGADNNHRVRCQTGHTALDIQEFFRAQVGTEAGFGHGIVSHAHGHAGCHHGVAAVCDVCERSAVHEGRSAFQRLNQVRLQGITQQRSHGAGRLQIARGYRLVIIGIGYNDPGQARFQVCHGGSQAEHCHDLAGHGDIEAVLTGCAVGFSAQAVYHKAELAVIHVHAALPRDLLHINPQGIPLLDMVVQHSGKQVVRRADGMEVTGKVEVDIFHGHHLGISAACSSALHTEDRTKAGLPQGHRNILADPGQAVRQSDRCGGFAFTRGGGSDRRHQDQFAGFPVRFINQGWINLGLVAAVLFHVLLVYVGLFRDLHDRLHFTLLGNLDVG